MSLIYDLKIIEEKELIKYKVNLYQKFLKIKKHIKSRESTIPIASPLYVLQNYRHSDAIINILSSFNHKRLFRNTPLNKYEIFLLISAAYLHDLGMTIIKDEDKKSINGIDINNVREKHHIRSAEYIFANKNELGLNDFEAFNLAMICKGHRKENLYNNPNYVPVPCVDDPNMTIRINLLAALIRIADELDICFNRVQDGMKEFLNNYHTFDTITNLHWYKHYYTINCFLNFIEKPSELMTKLLIKFVFRLPNKDYEKSFIIPFVMNPIKKEIDYLQHIFNYYGFSIDLQTPDIRINESINIIPQNIYNDIFKFILKNKNIKILIVDDDEITRKDLSYIINDMGYQVDKAVDSKNALEKIQKNGYHLILLDLKMPDLNSRTRDDSGLELLKLIKNMEKNHIVVIISAIQESPLIIDSFRNGAYDYITKDMSTEEIMKRLENVIKMNFYILEVN